MNINYQNDTVYDKDQEELFKAWLKDTLLTINHRCEINEDSLGMLVTRSCEVEVRKVRINKYVYDCKDKEDSLLISLHLDILKAYHKRLPRQFKLCTAISCAYFVSYYPGTNYDSRNGFDEHSILITDKDSVRYDFFHSRINGIKCYYNNGNDSISFRVDDYVLWRKMKNMYK